MFSMDTASAAVRRLGNMDTPIAWEQQRAAPDAAPVGWSPAAEGGVVIHYGDGDYNASHNFSADEIRRAAAEIAAS